MILALLLGLALGQEPPSDHSLIYLNARLALREGQPLEATRFWLLRNAYEDYSGVVSPHDIDFRSVTWAALGELGVCQDGFGTDEDGAGIWPLALHNWFVRNRTRRNHPKKPRPFEAFEVGRQQRFISIGDVLSAEELNTVRLFRGFCARPRLALIAAGEPVMSRLSERRTGVVLLGYLLEKSRDTLSDDLVRGTAAIDARLFDIQLQLADLAAAEARAKARAQATQGRLGGLGRPSIEAMRDQAPTTTLEHDSVPAQILEASVDWPVDEWMALSPDRRLFIYDQAKAWGGEPEKLDAVALGVIDELIARADGKDVDRWIAHRSDDPVDQEAIWDGDRGRRLLALAAEDGFSERAVIALHRGVRALERGDLPGSLRAFAYSLQYSPESRASEEVHSLGLRWLTYVTSKFEITNELLVTLRELVPRREYAILLEDLMWGAAFRADAASFERGVRNQAGRGALERRLDLLFPLAAGDLTRFSDRLEERLESSPSEGTRFIDQFVQRIELEDGGIRARHVPTLRRIRTLLAPMADVNAQGRQARKAGELLDRTHAILEGVAAREEDMNARDRAHALGPDAEVFAGSVRLAPVDPLPWPFRAEEVRAPSVFEPLELRPVEWRDEDGEWVYGWSIEG